MKHKFVKRLLAFGLCGILLSTGSPVLAGMEYFQTSVEYLPFSDVDAGAWYAEDVRRACELGILNGKPGGVFDPYGALTLGEAATLAANIRSVYNGGGFIPGGSPWYQNAVNYGIEQGFLLRGEYADYTAPATRADMAGIFAYTLPSPEYERINRIAEIPDVDNTTTHNNAIYFLYNAGILTGDSGGAFRPHDGVTRAEAAAIVNRLALPESRKTVSFIHPQNGRLIGAPDGSVQLLVPPDWLLEQSEDAEGFSLAAGPANGNVSLELLQFWRSGLDITLDAFTAGVVNAAREESGGAILIGDQPQPDTFRGLKSFSFSYSDSSGRYIVYCIESSACFYALFLYAAPSGSAEETAQLERAAYSLDIAL